METEIIEILKKYVDFSAYDRGGVSDALYQKLATEISDIFEKKSEETFKEINDSYERVKMELSALRGAGWMEYLSGL